MRSVKKLMLSLVFGLFLIFFVLISLWRYHIGQVFYYDFGHFERILWLISRFQEPIIQHKVLGEINFLGDHFSPSVFLLAPLFWITNQPQIMLIEQAIATVIAGVLIYLIAQKNKLSFVTSLIISCVFLLFAGIENPLITDWHTESTSVVFLLLFIYLFFYQRKKPLGIICALIFVGFKDSNALSLIFILIPFWFSQKKERIEITFLILSSFLWFFIVSYLLSPLIAGKPYLYSPVLPQKKIEFITNFFNLPIKRKLLFDSFISFGFVPLLSGFYLFPIIGELSIRLVPTYIHSQSFTLGMHYNVYLGAFLSMATIKTIKRWPKSQILIAIFLAATSILTAKFITKPPILLITNKVFWNEWNKKAELYKQVSLVPKNGSIMSQNNMLPHLLQRKEKVYLLSLAYKKIKPTYILFDLSEGQNVNNYYSGEINSKEQVKKLLDLLKEDKSYREVKTVYSELHFFKRL